jgi:hypothetical protein
LTHFWAPTLLVKYAKLGLQLFVKKLAGFIFHKFVKNVLQVFVRKSYKYVCVKTGGNRVW